MERPIFKIFRIAFVACALILSSGEVRAEFIQTSNYFQSSDGFSRVVPTELGIYFLTPKNKISIQEFDVSKVTEGTDAFLEFDKNINRFTALIFGTKRFEIRGSFSLITGKMTIKVDNYANPYCTVEISPENQPPSIIAFQGVTAVANYKGRSAVAILGANQIFENLSDIHPYIHSENDSLTLGGNDVTSEYIGLDIQVPESPCLLNSNSIVFLKAQELAAIRNNKDPLSRKAQLEEAIKKNKVNVLKDLILLKANKSVIALDPRDSTIKSITLVNNDPKICEIRNIDLN